MVLLFPQELAGLVHSGDEELKSEGMMVAQHSDLVRARSSVSVTVLHDADVVVMPKLAFMHAFPTAIAWKQYVTAAATRLALFKRCVTCLCLLAGDL